MKKILFIAVAAMLCLSLGACSVPNPFVQGSGRETGTETASAAPDIDSDTDTAKYHFESIDDDEILDSYQFMTMIAGYPSKYEEQCAVIQGKLLTLFGEPLYESADYEYAYDYAIKATDGSGSTWYLSVYQGYYGPAIGTYSTGDEMPEIVYVLYNEIMAASPSDFQYDGFYTETPSKIRAGVANGKAYYSEEVITDPEEIQRMYDILGWEPDDLESEDPFKL